MKLSIELVPKTSWYSNVRSNVSTGEWDIIRKISYKKANYCCEICGEKGKAQGYPHDLECHEIWEYNDIDFIQKLVGLISLCPNCHTVKHPGLAQIKGKGDLVIHQLSKVNKISIDEAKKYLSDCFEIWRRRSKNEYHLDITYLQTYNYNK